MTSAGTREIDIILDEQRERSETGNSLGIKSLRFGRSGGLIGRDAGNCALVVDLPYVSRRHARISRCGEDFFIEDLDTVDGTVLNELTLDAGRKYSLKDDDRVTVGDVTIVIKPKPWWEEDDGIAPPSKPPPESEEPQGSDSKTVSPEPVHADDELSKTIFPPHPDSARELIGAFLTGLRVSSDGIDRSQDPIQFMRMAGHLLYVSIDGIRKALVTHDSFRDQYRIPGTVLRRSQMNPLYNQQIETAKVIEVLLSHSTRAIVDPVRAIEEATTDFYMHGIAVPTAVDQAIRAVFGSFDWRRVEADLGGNIGAVFFGPFRQARLWALYRAEYDRRAKTLNEFDNDYRRAVGNAYSEARREHRLGQNVQGDH